MAGDAHVNESQFTGLSKYFNSTTIRGRANVSSEFNITFTFPSPFHCVTDLFLNVSESYAAKVL